jgi:hypothetical protein
MPCRDKIRTHAHIDHLPIRQRLLPEGFGLDDIVRQGEGIVDQNVEAALFTPYLFEQGRHGRIVGVVYLDRDAFAAARINRRCGFAHRSRQRVGAAGNGAPRDINSGALCAERERDPLANAAAGTGYQRDLACQGAHFAFLMR